ncbi:hypothetical protein PMI01_02446 [Caulobacter sp. AP07]|uniref:DUF4153 domain-containing protein n=1 Tax=Caulobacter sp. AP07 TaxID=1144304 RepID=UPI000271EDD2|nr:DUF4153 domain-containing protein [Caulobacter sp. AP07]EJL32807.1 hypothetical protein PMI01_02446 [Caulobacter sp. AP07]
MTDAFHDAALPDSRAVRRATIIRLATGLAQGLLLYGLYQADKSKVWPATQRELYAALLMVFLFAPFVVLAGVSALRFRTLAVWKGVAALVAAGLGAYGVWSGDPAAKGVNGLGPLTVLGVAALIFIGHHLVQPADMERRRIARYEAYFDVTWKHGVQAVLSLGFTGAFWLLLFLAAALFKLIGVDAIEKLIRHEWFIFPATAVVFAAAVQLTDVRANLVRGVRTVVLTLLAWLLPLMALIAAAFLLTLPFTGLEPLWKTKSATAILLVADAFLILLTDAAYQDGTETTAVVLKWAARLAGVLLVPITVLAAYGLSLRIGQYGLSPDRIIAAACVLVAAGYAVGYAVAAVRPGAWMRTLEATNIAMAFVVIAVLLALCTPIADPRRLSVNDQVARLEKGKVRAEAFDYQFLRFDAGRFGRNALDRLKTSSDPKIVQRAKAVAVQAGRNYSPPPRPAYNPRIVFHPKGARPPEGFPTAVPPESRFGGCLSSDAVCDATVLDMTGDGRPEVLMTSGWEIEVYGAGADGAWLRLGGFQPPCSGFDSRAAIRDGKLSAATPAVQDLVSANGPMRFAKDLAACP